MQKQETRDEAEKWFKKTLEMDPELIEPRFELLDTLSELGKQKGCS